MHADTSSAVFSIMTLDGAAGLGLALSKSVGFPRNMEWLVFPTRQQLNLVNGF